MKSRPQKKRQRQAGFSLVELVIAMLIAIEILIGAAIAFDVHNRIARVQLQVTDMQQSLRVAQYDIARMLREAGRGGLPPDLAPAAVFDPSPPANETVQLQGIGIEVRDNVTGNDRYIARGDNTSPLALDDTDILTVRGCFSSSMYVTNVDSFTIDPSNSNQATLLISARDDPSATQIHQPLGSLMDAINAYPADAAVKGKLVMVSPEGRSTWGVADIVGVSTTGTASDPSTATLTLKLDTLSPLNPGTAGVRPFPDHFASLLACSLEEYRFYVRKDYEIPGDPASGLRPRLTEARFEPGTELPYLGDTANFKVDLADNIIDLQVALGIDTPYSSACGSGCSPGTGYFQYDDNAVGPDDELYEAPPTGDRAHDDWLYNDTGDVPADTFYVSDAADLPAKLYFVRITTVARTARADPTYSAANFSNDASGGADWIEDHNYNAAPTNAFFKAGDALKHRHRVLTTVVYPRNL